MLGACSLLPEDGDIFSIFGSEEEEEEGIEERRPQSTEFAYEVEFRGLEEGKEQENLKSLMGRSSQLRSLKERPPPTFMGLEQRVNGDAERFRQVLRSEGYYSGEVSLEINRDAKPIQIKFDVRPGPRYTISSFESELTEETPKEGAPDLPEAQELGIKIGQPARGAAVVDAENKLLTRLRNDGYPFATVEDRQAVVDRAANTMQVTLVVAPGPLSDFGALSVNGLEGVREDYVRRLIEWEPGKRYSQSRVREVQTTLADTGLFEAVDVSPANEPDAEGRVPVTVTLTEGKQRSIGLGASYSTDEGFGGEASWEHRNILGRGERLSVGIDASQLEQEFLTEFTKPNFLERDLEFDIDVFARHQDSDAYSGVSAGTFVGLQRPFLDNWEGRGGISFEYANLEDNEEEEQYTLVGLPVTARRDATNNLLDPTEGTRVSLAFTPYVGQSDKTLNFFVAEANGSAYYSLDEDGWYVLAARARLGSIVGEERGEVPPNKRFYAGGGGSIRGYEFQTVGPLDEDDDPIGGRSVAEVSVEFRTRITETIGLVPFISGGNVYESSWIDPTEGFQWAGGLGFRYYTPIGPLRADVAFPINGRDRDDVFQFYISIGQAF